MQNFALFQAAETECITQTFWKKRNDNATFCEFYQNLRETNLCQGVTEYKVQEIGCISFRITAATTGLSHTETFSKNSQIVSCKTENMQILQHPVMFCTVKLINT